MMTPEDAQAFDELLARFYVAHDQIRDDTPAAISDYCAAVVEVAVVANRLHALITNGQTTIDDILAAHVRVQQQP